MFKPLLTARDIAERYNRWMPETIRDYLKTRGIAASFIDEHLLGWNGATDRIVIPVFGDTKHDVLGFRYAPAPEGGRPTTASEGMPGPAIYGLETLARKPHRVVICEDEFDRLLLHSHSIPAVSVIGGADQFPSEWASLFDGIPDVYVCFHRSLASDAAAKRVQAILPNARIARLPSEVGEGGTISTYVVDLLQSVRDFEIVLASGIAGTQEEIPSRPQPMRFANRVLEKRANQVRKHVRLHDVAFQLMELQASGGRLVGHCPFHDDTSRSFAIYPSTDTYRCSACGAEGDVLKFLADEESMLAEEALERLEVFQITREIYGTC